MKRASIAALTAIALAVPYVSVAQGDAKATVTAKLATVVDGAGVVAPNPCVVVNAADYGKVQEAACDGGLGYLIVAGPKGPVALHCAQVASDVDEKGQIAAACQLPENRDELKVIDTVLKATNTACNPVARSYFGESASGSSVFLEAVCDNAKGYLIQVWKAPADVKQFGNKAWICDDNFKSRGNDCELTKAGVPAAKTAETKRVAVLDTYYKGAAAAPKAPTTVAVAAPAAAAAPAASATFSGTLTPAFTKALSDSGLSCPTNPPKVREDTDDHTILEFRCSAKDDGRVGILSKKTAAPAVFDCASVNILGFKCEDTTEKVGYTALSTSIRRQSSGSFGGDCSVSSMRVMGAGPTSGTIEVKCTDARIGGEVLTVSKTTGKLTNVTSCASFASSPGQTIRCELPGAAR